MIFSKSPVEKLNLIEVHDLATTKVKDQHKSSTCWSFAGISFIESEMLRKGLDVVDLSEMFVVRKCYEAKVEKYIRLHGNMKFTPGGLLHDVFWVMDNFGLMPEDAYGSNNEPPTHSELDMKMHEVAKLSVKRLKNDSDYDWKGAVNKVLNRKIGDLPDSFIFNTKSFTALTFKINSIQIDADDYVFLTSYLHHPFNQSFSIEIPDNWMWSEVFNIPLSDYKNTIRIALKQGFTLGVAMDITEKEFNFSKGYAHVAENYSGMNLDELLDIRQQMFDNYSTTDDHGMHVVGYALDEEGNYFYKVKNSWDTSNSLGGNIYVSEEYLLLKSIYFVVHKSAFLKDK